MSGFNELVPQELIMVFDERELELLIGGMSEIDVYVCFRFSCYPILIFIILTETTGTSILITEVMRSLMRSYNGSGKYSVPGPLRRNPVFCNLPLVHQESQSMGSRLVAILLYL